MQYEPSISRMMPFLNQYITTMSKHTSLKEILFQISPRAKQSKAWQKGFRSAYIYTKITHCDNFFQNGNYWLDYHMLYITVELRTLRNTPSIYFYGVHIAVSFVWACLLQNTPIYHTNGKLYRSDILVLQSLSTNVWHVHSDIFQWRAWYST